MDHPHAAAYAGASSGHSRRMCGAAAGCAGDAKESGTPSRTAAPELSATAPVAQITKCCLASPSPQLVVALTPSAGPPGTLVRITASGCVDASGRNHAVSFNNDAHNPSARNDPNTVRTIASTFLRERLTATYRIRPGDRTGGVGSVFGQCGSTVKTADFRVTR